MNDQNRPADWKHFDDFAAGIATNRLATTSALRGQTFKITLNTGRTIDLAFTAADTVAWSEEAMPAPIGTRRWKWLRRCSLST